MGGKTGKILGFAILLLLASCVKDAPSLNSQHILPRGSNNVFVVCEGSYGYGNASLYDWQPTADSIFGDLYHSANGGAALGDIFQSMTRIGQQYYLCVNNSDRVTLINSQTYRQTGYITVPKPRYIADAGNGYAFVSSLYSDKVFRINTQTQLVADTLSLGAHNTEGMCILNTRLYVCCWDTTCNTLVEMDATTGLFLRRIRVAGHAPQEVLTDKEQMLWVLSGNAPDGTRAALTRLDPSTGAILDSFTFPLTANPVKPVFNPSKDTLYFIEANYSGTSANNGVYRMSIHDAQLPASPFITAGTYTYFWALGIDPSGTTIYVGDPKGFSQAGFVYTYRRDGAKTDSFKVGIGPGHFYFDN